MTLRELLNAANAGDPDAIEKLFVTILPVIQNACGRYETNQHPDWSVSDLIQEVSLRVLLKLDKFDYNHAEDPRPQFEQWLRVTTKNVLLNLQRNQKTQRKFGQRPNRQLDESLVAVARSEHTDRTASSILSQIEQEQRLLKLIEEELSVEEKQVLLLRITEGQSLRKISQDLSLSYDQVRYRFESSLSKLQQHLSDNNLET